MIRFNTIVVEIPSKNRTIRIRVATDIGPIFDAYRGYLRQGMSYDEYHAIESAYLRTHPTAACPMFGGDRCRCGKFNYVSAIVEAEIRGISIADLLSKYM